MKRMGTECSPALNSGCRHLSHGAWLDHRLALVHPEQGWLAVADLHLGYARRRRQGGFLIPDWGGEEIEDRLSALLLSHQPRRLILVGDIVDGAGSVDEGLKVLERLRARVPELLLLAGNHDRPALRRAARFLASHEETGFIFHHGHLNPACPAGSIEITGHHHPAVLLRDGAGLRLKLPALIRERDPGGSAAERWILPALSPWAAGGEYHSPYERLATWACAPGRVWPMAEP